MSSNFQRQAIINKTINLSNEAIKQLKDKNKFLNKSKTKINSVIQDEELIKSIYSNQTHYENTKQYLADIKLIAETLELANLSDISDHEKLKNILENHKLPNKELLRLQSETRKSLNASHEALEKYMQTYQQAINKIPFLELCEDSMIPFS